MLKTNTFKPAMALFMAILMLLTALPVEIFAQVKIEKTLNTEEKEYIYMDGERIAIDDERVQNYVNVSPKLFASRSLKPNPSGIAALSGDYNRTSNVTMDGTKVSPLRYVVKVDNVEYEAFCADPKLRGPENSAAIYELLGEANAKLKNALKNGYPINTDWSNLDNDVEDRMWNAYITRVAVAMANNPTRNFAGDATAMQQAKQLADGALIANHSAYPAIMVNSAKDAKDTGRTVEASESEARSQEFEVTYNRKTNLEYNPFRFEWESSTPAGAKLIINNTVVATAPTNPDEIFKDDISSFQIEMPNESTYENQEAKVKLVGLHNQFSDKIWLMQNPTSPDSWQDIVFYIPEMSASATFSFGTETIPDEANLKIIKRNPSGKGLAGAVFEVESATGFSKRVTTPSNGAALVTGLDPGEYTITEITPPTGHKLANPASVKVTLAANSTETIERIFVNEPDTPPPTPQTTSVKIQKVDALTRKNIPGALVRLKGMSAHFGSTSGGHLGDVTWSFNNTGINLSQVMTDGATTGSGEVKSTVKDGVWELEGLPYGYYQVEEERAPENYSLLPQHTAYGFWLTPPNVVVNVDDWDVLVTYDGVVQSFREVSAWDLPDNITLNDVTKLLETLGETFEVVFGFKLTEEPQDSSVLVTFENYPFGEITLEKVDDVTGKPVAGAKMKIEGFFPEGNNNGIPIDRTETTDSQGKITFDKLPAGNYTIREVWAPEGYLLSNEVKSVPLTWGQHATVTFVNIPKTSLELIKIDANTSAPLDGAIFTLREPTSGETWQSEASGGQYIFGIGSNGNELVAGKTYILKEIQAPVGYILDTTEREIVLKNVGVNQITVKNWNNPSLTIVKRDKNNGQPRLPGAVFEVNYENGKTVTGSPFTTNANGEIVIKEVLFDNTDERTLIITETIPPDGFNLSDPNWQRVTVRKGEDNVVVFENTRKPTLEIHKVDAINGKNLSGAEFTIEKLEEPGKGMLTGNPFTTDSNGKIKLPYQYSGKYKITEVKSPNNYWFDPLEQNRSWIIDIKPNEDYYLRVENTLLPTLIITKWNYVTYKPVPLTHFKVEYEVPNSGQVQLVGEFVTNNNGQIVIPYTKVGWYKITETKAAPGMSLNTNNSYRIYLNPGDNSYMPIPDVTGNNPNLNPEMPVFKDIKVFGGNDFFVSGSEQISYPDGSIVVKGKENETFTISNATNLKMARSLVQVDVNAQTIGEFSADSSGILVISGLENAKYSITNAENKTETTFLSTDGSAVTVDFTAKTIMPTPTPEPPTTPTAPPTNITEEELENLVLDTIKIVEDETLAEQVTRNVSVGSGEMYYNTGTGIWNYPLNSIVIKKSDATNGKLLAGATFDLIYTSSGESGTKGTVIGRYTTNFSGIIVITGLEPGAYVAEEALPPNNYMLSENNRQTAYLKPDGHSIVEVEFSNYPYGSLLITKRDEITTKALQGAEFKVATSDGTLIGTANGIFTTNQQGEILIPNLKPDSYVVTEVTPPNGYIIGKNATQTITVKPDGQVYALNFTNEPFSSLTVRKLDSFDNSPIPLAKFRVERQNGEFVGEYETNEQGLFSINGILGWFKVTEIDPASGYVLDSTMQTAEVKAGEPTVLVFYNARQGGLTIEKLDQDGKPLAGASFKVTKQNGELVGTFTSNASGIINVGQLKSGWHIVEETRAPQGYVISDVAQSVEIKPNAQANVTFVNIKEVNFTIKKIDEEGNPLVGAKFTVSQIDGAFKEEVTTGTGGIASLILPEGSYEVVETQAPKGFAITEAARTIHVKPGENKTETFVNKRIPALVIEKVDENGKPLADAEFEIRKLDGGLVERVTSNIGGTATVAELAAGSYEVLESRAPQGYVVEKTSQVIEIKAGETKTIRFVNIKIAEVMLKKIDGETGEVLRGVEFEITHQNGEIVRNPADNSNRFVTDNGGLIYLPHLTSGAYVASETKALDGYSLAEAKHFTVTDGQNQTIIIENYKKRDTVIKKIDGDTKSVLTGVQFEIANYVGNSAADKLRNPIDGSYIWTTDNSGLIKLPTMENGTYVATEIKPLSGYLNAEPRIFTVGNNVYDNKVQTIIIENFKRPEVTIKKVDGDSNAALQGVVFEIRAMNGEKIRNPQTGTYEFVTDNGGLIHLPLLDSGAYTAIETKPFNGYRSAEPTNFEIKNGENQTVLIKNFKQAELTIKKINSETRESLQGVIFEMSKPNGERLVNPKTGTHDFTTDKNGLIYLSVIEDGNYWITETKALNGYIAKPEPLLLTIDSTTRQREHLLVIENTPASGLIIVKTDAQTKKPLAGVVFEVRHADGRVVERNILDGNQNNTEHNSPQLNSENGFTTDNSGRINLNHLAPGVYHVVEVKQLDGYELDTKVHVVTVEPGKQAVLEVENTPLSGLRIKKTDAITGQPIFNVEFMLFDQNGKVVGNFYSDNRGIVEFPALLVAGRYTIRETRPAAGYATDDLPRTVDFVPGKVTEIEWTNMPMGGQLQIGKISGDYNEQNALPAGTPLSGAIFEIYSYKTGNLVDRIISDHRGMAVSKPLPLGRYYSQEVTAPAYYKINPQKIDFDIEFDRQIIKVSFPNYSANIGVTIDKVGPRETMQGTNIFYDIKTVRNDSSVPLTDFFWRDILPVNAVRADKLVTGTYNQSLKYKVLGTTNKGNEIVVADNLSTTRNNVVELKPVHLGLATDEYLVSFTLYFGTVPAGFTAVDKPKVYVDVLPKSHTFLQNGLMFANKVDIGGKVAGTNEFVISNSTTATTIYNPSSQKLPKSGY